MSGVDGGGGGKKNDRTLCYWCLSMGLTSHLKSVEIV